MVTEIKKSLKSAWDSSGRFAQMGIVFCKRLLARDLGAPRNSTQDRRPLILREIMAGAHLYVRESCQENPRPRNEHRSPEVGRAAPAILQAGRQSVEAAIRNPPPRYRWRFGMEAYSASFGPAPARSRRLP